jgi:capsid protein
VLDRILAAWLAEAHRIPGLLLGAGTEREMLPAHTWFFDGHEHVDPLKESSAQALRLANHTTTYADEYARRGLDWETQLRQRAKELELMSQLGLPLPGQCPDQHHEESDAETADEHDRAA